MDFDSSEVLWVEKYRPKFIKDCILRSSTKTEFESIVKEGSLPNLMLYGPPGTGKTTTAKALCNELNIDWIIINASNERGIDTLRDKITNFASTTSLGIGGNGRKCVILDEFDNATNIFATALRSDLEKFSKNCSFILTANYPNRIIPALHSRFVGIDFGADKKEMEKMQAQFFMRVIDILDNENVSYDEKALIAVIQKYFPDNRKILGILQQYGRHGKIDEGVLMNLEEVSIDKLIESIKNKKFKQIIQFAEDNKDNDTSSMYENIYKTLKEWVEPSSIPDAIMILQEYQKSDAIVPSKELHLASMCTEMMTTLEFR